MPSHPSDIATIADHFYWSEGSMGCKHQSFESLEKSYPQSKMLGEAIALVSQALKNGPTPIYALLSPIYVYAYFYRFKHVTKLQLQDTDKLEKHMRSLVSRIFTPSSKLKERLRNETAMRPHFASALECADFIMNRIGNAETFRDQIMDRMQRFDEALFNAGQVIGQDWKLEPAIIKMAEHATRWQEFIPKAS